MKILKPLHISLLLVATFLGSGILPADFASYAFAAEEKPVVTTGSVQNVFATLATLQGQMNASGAPTSYWFEYGTTDSLGSRTPVQAGGEGTAPISVSSIASGLTANTMYYFRLIAQYRYGQSTGDIQSFSTNNTSGGTLPKTGVTGLTGVVVKAVQPTNAIFNNNASDYPTLETANHTKNPGTLQWGNSTTAEAGDIIDFKFYYHNNSTITAKNTKMRLAFEYNPIAQQVRGIGSLWADNAATVTGYTTVNILHTPAQPWIMTFDSAYWYPDRDSTNAKPLPGTQTGNEVTLGGTNIGDVAGGWSTAGYYVVRFKFVAATDPNGSTPSVTTVATTQVSATAATLHANINPNNKTTTYWFEYGTTQSLGLRTATQSLTQSLTTLQPVGAVISNLNSQTTYYYRAVGENERGRTNGDILSFTTVEAGTISAPNVATLPADTITASAATFRGTIQPNNAQTSYWFEYGTTESLGLRTATQSAQGATVQSVSATLSNLTAQTQYCYRLVAQNSAGRTNGDIICFRTTTGGGDTTTVPIVVTSGADAITASAARLNGRVTPGGLATTYWFEYGTSASLGLRTATQSAGTTEQDVFAQLTNLPAHTTYYYRIAAQNSKGTVYGAVISFTTLTGTTGSQAPTVTTNNATNITQTTATLQGAVNPNGYATSYWFEYGASSSLGTATTHTTIGSGTTTQSVLFDITGLSAATTYYYRVVASNSVGQTAGAIISFTTNSSGGSGGGGGGTSGGGGGPRGPLMTTDNASNISLTEATVYGSIFTNGSDAYVWFEYGIDKDGLDTKTSEKRIENSSKTNSFNATISGLQAGKTYYFRAVGRNTTNTSYGQILSMNTFGTQVAGKLPRITTKAPTFVSQNSGLLNALVNPNGVGDTVAWFEYGTTPALGSRTTEQKVGSGSQDAQTSYAVTGLTPNTTYYYRAAARNAYGTVYSYILAIQTNVGVVGSVNRTTTVVTTSRTTTPAGATGNAEACILIVPTTVPEQMNAGEDFTYTITYRNGCAYDFEDVSLRIITPLEVEITKQSASKGTVEQTANALTYTLGTLQQGDQGVVTIQGTVSTGVNKGDILIFSSVLQYTDAQKQPQTISSYLTSEILSGRTLTASVLDAFRGLFGSWWFSLLLLLIIGFLIYWIFFKRNKEEEENTMPVIKA